MIAWGSCASNGCVQAAPNPTGAVPVHEMIRDKPIVKVPGCPPIAEVMTGVLTYVLTFGRLPELDRIGRPKMFYEHRLHDRCGRRAFFDNGQFVEEWDDEGAKNGWCLYKMGCRGPTTYNSCATFKWNGGTSWPIGSGHGCIGCSEENFWDDGPFYERLSHTVLPGVEATPKTIGKVLTVAAAAGIAAHLAALGDPIAYARGTRARTIPTPRNPRRSMVVSTTRVVVDPVTRIEGHLRIEAMLDDKGVINEALSTGTMWRGLEVILKGRDPRDAWAFTERICGVCTTVHALASVRAVEDALADPGAAGRRDRSATSCS